MAPTEQRCVAVFGLLWALWCKHLRTFLKAPTSRA